MLNPSLIAKAHFAMDRGFLRNASGATALYIHYAYLSAVLSEYEVDGCRYEDALVWARGRSTPGYPLPTPTTPKSLPCFTSLTPKHPLSASGSSGTTKQSTAPILRA